MTTCALNEHPTTAEILGRLLKRRDLTVEVIATLHLAAELAILREHDCYNAGYQDGLAQASRGLHP